LSVRRLLILQQKPKVGRTKPSNGPQVGHSCPRVNFGVKIIIISSVLLSQA